MKLAKYVLLTAIISMILAGCGTMETTALRNQQEKVVSIINQMPACDSQQQDQLAAELAALNPQAAHLLVDMLQPPTNPTDNAARYGLSAMAHYTSGAANEAERKVYADALIEVLPTVANKQNKAFIITQLQFVGKQEAVKPLSAYLNDDLLCDYAARALLTIGGRDVEEVFLNAFDAANDINKVTLIKALGEMQSKAAAAKIAVFTTSSDTDARETALYALANIGDPASDPILKNACRTGSDFEQIKHQSQYLLFARRLAETGNKDICKKICKSISSNTSYPENLRMAAENTLRSVLGQTQAPAGFTSLFNGKDLTGWKMHDGLPGDKKPTGKWFVEDGAIVGVQDPPGKGGFLATTKTFRDFELQLETKIDWPFDTGVFLRVGPDGKSHQVTLDYRDGGEIGGIYCPWTQNWVKHCPDGIKSFKKDQWNKLRIKCTGEPAHIQVWLNDTQITDFQHTAETTAGIPEEGTICLQVHPGGKGYDKSRGRFRNIYIRPLESTGPLNVLTAEEKAQGFVSLFNGKDLTGWVGSKDTYGVKDGILFCRKGTGRNIYTENEYGDFVLRFEFKLQPGTNNGLGIRTPIEGDAAYVGMELQILDNTAEKYSNLHDWQYHGSVYGIIAADDKLRYSAFNPVGQWNTEEVIANGDHIIVKVNGKTIVDDNIREAVKKDGPLSGKEHPGLFNKKGHIGFLGHGDYVEFRNIRIRSLK